MERFIDILCGSAAAVLGYIFVQFIESRFGNPIKTTKAASAAFIAGLWTMRACLILGHDVLTTNFYPMYFLGHIMMATGGITLIDLAWHYFPDQYNHQRHNRKIVAALMTVALLLFSLMQLKQLFPKS